MPHIEEGELHALLDGAYAHDGPAAARIREEIASCIECRTRFDEAQAMRMRASAILGRALPSTTAPPFDAVLQRAEIVDAPRRFSFPGGARLAWAATIVLALGIGWFGRDRLYTGRPSTATQFDAAARTQSEPAAQPPAPTASAPAEAAAPAPQRANTNAMKPQVTPPSAEGAAEKRMAGAQTNARDERADKFAERKEVGREESKARTAGERRSENAVAQGAQERDSTRARVAQAPPSAAPATAKAEFAAASRLAGALPDSTWQYGTVQEAERITGGRVLRIPGLEVVNVGVNKSAGRFVTRTVQRFPDGNLIEIVQQPRVESDQLAAGQAARSAGEAAPPSSKDATGATVLTLTRNEWVLTGRGTLSVDSLRVLLNNVR